jgi:LDH2 family malate/lactate/ureidoglycolate dehydrogenase
MQTYSSHALHRVSSAIFRAVGAPEDIADDVSTVLIDNHLAGHDSHGIIRIPQYVKCVRTGETDPTARPSIVTETASTALVRGNWAFGQIVANLAADLVVTKAAETGLAAVAVVEACHTGRLAAFIESAATAAGVAVFMTTGTGGAGRTAPFGGAGGSLGTNPVAFVVPDGAGGAITLDYATTGVAAGKVRVALAKDEALPEGVMVDKDGKPSTNPADFETGFLLPFGGHKGYALAVISDLLSGPLAGADAYPGVVERAGLFLFAVSTTAFRDAAGYRDAVAKTVARIKGVPPAPGFDEVLMPGEPEIRARKSRQASGIPVPDKTWTAVSELASELGVDVSTLVE